MPRSLQAQMTRTAISPRLAIRTFWNISAGADREQSLSVLNWPAVFHKLRYNRAGDLRLDLIHQLHGFDNAEHLAWLHDIAYLDERGIARFRRLVVSPHDGGLDDHLVPRGHGLR